MGRKTNHLGLADEYKQRAAAAGASVAEILEKEGAQARALFDRIRERHGLATAKLLFERCIKLAKEPTVEEEQELYAEAKEKAKADQRLRAMTKLPTAEEIAAALAADDRKRIYIWYYRFPARNLKPKEKEIFDLLWRAYVQVGGYPEGFKPEALPPTKKRGSLTRNSPNAELPAIFEREKARLGEQFSKPAFYRKYADRFGPTPEDVRKKLDYYIKRKT